MKDAIQLGRIFCLFGSLHICPAHSGSIWSKYACLSPFFTPKNAVFSGAFGTKKNPIFNPNLKKQKAILNAF